MVSESFEDELDVLVASDPNYEEVIAEIYFEGRLVAWVSQELGPDKLRLHTPGPDSFEPGIAREMDLCRFLKSVDRAKERLLGDEESKFSLPGYEDT